ncbi:MAG: 30S ribosomal protein S13 [Patescibacteria group bacterium]
MPRIAGRDIPENKKIEFSLRYIYGIGPTNAAEILAKAKLDGNIRTKDLTAEELARLQKCIDEVKVEGDLRKTIQQNISRLKEIGSYRGHRHVKGLPVRGQRTRTNARTKRGKRMTIGALKKETLATKEEKK